MKQEVLLALFGKFLDEKLKQLPKPLAGPRGVRGPRGDQGLAGPPGKDFVFAEHEAFIRAAIKDASLKFSDLVQEEIEQLRGPRGRDGRDGKDFVFSEHEGRLREIAREVAVKFEDFTAEQIHELRGPAGKDGRPGKDFDLEENREALTEIARSVALRFEDFSAEQIEQIRGPRGRDGKDGVAGADGRSFIFDEHVDDISALLRRHVDDIRDGLRLKFSDLSAEEIEAIRGPRGREGRDGKDFVFEEHVDKIKVLIEGAALKFDDLTDAQKDALRLKFENLTADQKQELKLRFSDLTDEERISLKGSRGQRGKAGPQGERGEKGETGARGPQGRPGLNGVSGRPGRDGVNGLDGRDGKDGRQVVGVDVDQWDQRFYLVFKFDDGTEIRTEKIDLPESRGDTIYIVGGFAGGGGGSGSGTPGPQGPPGEDGAAGPPGKSAYEVAVENGFVGTEEEWLESLVGPQGPAGADGADGADGAQGPQGPPGDAGDGTLEEFDCDSDVYVGAAVRLASANPVDSVMQDWPNLLHLYALDSQTYDVVAVLALADSLANSNVYGIVESKPSSTRALVRAAGVSAENYFGLDVEDEYYLSDENPGALVPSANMPSDPGSVIIKIGQPRSSTRLLYERGERTVIPPGGP